MYTIYFEAFSQTTLQVSVLSDLPKRRIDRLTLPRAICTHIFHILIGRMSVASQQGSIKPLFQSRFDVLPLKIIVQDEIVGFCFLLRLNPLVFELGIIGVLEGKRGLGIGFQAVEAVKRHVKRMGASRLIVRASGIKQVAGFFIKCGFKQAFSDEVFFLDF